MKEFQEQLQEITKRGKSGKNMPEKELTATEGKEVGVVEEEQRQERSPEVEDMNMLSPSFWKLTTPSQLYQWEGRSAEGGYGKT